MIYAKILTIFSIIFFLCSCSTPRPKGKTAAEVLYKEARTLVDDGRYILATEKISNLKSKYPYSYFSTHAELLQADIYYKQDNFVEAAAAYILFKDFHPKNEKMDYVVWKIAESFFNQLPSTFDRDLSAGKEAVKYYKYLFQNYPQTKYLKEAEIKIEKSREMIRNKDRYIADFYFKTGVYDAARFWYLNIIDKHKDKLLIEHSIKRVVESSYLNKEYKKCKKYETKLSPFVSEFVKKEVQSLGKKCQNKIVSKKN